LMILLRLRALSRPGSAPSLQPSPCLPCLEFKNAESPAETTTLLVLFVSAPIGPGTRSLVHVQPIPRGPEPARRLTTPQRCFLHPAGSGLRSFTGQLGGSYAENPENTLNQALTELPKVLLQRSSPSWVGFPAPDLEPLCFTDYRPPTTCARSAACFVHRLANIVSLPLRDRAGVKHFFEKIFSRRGKGKGGDLFFFSWRTSHILLRATPFGLARLVPRHKGLL